MKAKDPYDIVRAKHAKDASKHKRPKPLTTAERMAKRKHFWRKIDELADANKEKLRAQQVRDRDYSHSSSGHAHNVTDEAVTDYH